MKNVLWYRLRLTEGMIKQNIAELRKDAAAGPDGIPPKLLKALGDSILRPLLSLNEGKVPKGVEKGNCGPHIQERQQKRNR
jgi:hypothetical protein